MFPEILDANLNRASEGLRVIEEYARFVVSRADIARRTADLRHQIAPYNRGHIDQLQSRNTARDTRATETPATRKNIEDLLGANFHRVTEALRVLEEYSGNPHFSRLRYAAYDLEKDVMLSLLKPQLSRGVYVISHSVDVLIDAAQRGATVLQLRDKYASKSEILRRGRDLMKKKPPDIPVIINDFLDIVLAVNADGLHTGQDDLPIDTLRTLLGPHRLIGRTTHTLEQGQLAQAEGADYVSIGPVWDTPSKPGRDGIGFDYLAAASSSLTIPYVAIGGIDADRARDIARYSPPLVGVIRAVNQLEDIKSIVFDATH